MTLEGFYCIRLNGYEKTDLSIRFRPFLAPQAQTKKGQPVGGCPDCRSQWRV